MDATLYDYSNMAVVKTLIAAGVDTDAQYNGWGALHSASYVGRTETVKLLIDAGADLNAVDNNGKTALHHASSKGNTDIVRLLIAAGANTKAKDGNYHTALQSASYYNRAGVISLLMKADGNTYMLHERFIPIS